MKARELKVGDVIGPWTVVSVFEVCGVVESVVEDSPTAKIVSRNADPWNTLVMVELRTFGIARPTRAWYRADEEVAL